MYYINGLYHGGYSSDVPLTLRWYTPCWYGRGRRSVKTDFSPGPAENDYC